MRNFGRTLLFLMLYSFTLSEVIQDNLINKLEQSSYKLIYQAETWRAARDNCVKIGATLAVPESEEEFLHLQTIVQRMHYPSVIGTDYKLLVWLGISKLEDFHTWKNVNGEDINDTGFQTWAGDNNGDPTSDDPKEPHCAGMDATNFGLRDYWCHRQQPYICEIKTINN